MPNSHRFRWLTDNIAWRKVSAWVERYPRTASGVKFLLCWSLVNVLLDLRAPNDEAPGSYLLPSVDACVLLGIFALVGMLSVYGARRVAGLERLRVPLVFHVLVGIALFVIRIFRVGDGIAQTFQSRAANLFIDAPMLSELARLLYTTMPLYQFVGVGIGLVIVVPALVFLGYKCSRSLAEQLRAPSNVIVFAAVVGCFAIASLFTPVYKDDADAAERFSGAFAASVVPRLSADWRAFGDSRELAAKRGDRVIEARRTLERSSGNLSKLGGANVLLVIVESYGATLLTNPFYTERMDKLYVTLEKSFADDGYKVASTFLDSPTNGGFSWLAHATLLTGVRVMNQADYKFVTNAEPKGLVHFFKEAGYYTITAEPGTTRKVTGPDLFKFDTRISAARFGYRGPRYAWATMPDQLVLDTVHRRAITQHKDPLFIKYALVSSHGPWALQPPVIDDWSKIGNGEIYNHVDNVSFPTSWTNLKAAQGPYISSIEYTLEVIRRYLHEFIKDGSLVIILGDHQPTGKITNRSKDTRVPVHILSRNPEFVSKFIARGYIPGVRPDLNRPAKGMETFPGDFLEDFSDPKPAKGH
jgi:hypothetical protein